MRKTLKQMTALVRKYKRDTGMITTSRDILNAAGVGERDTRNQIKALQNFVRDRIKYIPDPRDVEMVQTPPRTLDIRTGDCDDKAVLLATLSETIGFASRFRAIGVNGGPYSHVLAEVRIGQRWLPLETIIAGVEPGWFPPDTTRFMVAHV